LQSDCNAKFHPYGIAEFQPDGIPSFSPMAYRVSARWHTEFQPDGVAEFQSSIASSSFSDGIAKFQSGGKAKFQPDGIAKCQTEALQSLAGFIPMALQSCSTLA
jgi:hypothetical protein